MQLDLDIEKLNEALSQAASRAVTSAFNGFDVQQALSNLIVGKLLDDSIRLSVENAVSQIDMDNLTEHISSELSDSLIRSATVMIHECFMEVIAKIRGVYTKEDRDKLRQEIFEVKP